MTSKPRTAPLRARATRAALGGGLVAAALLASGCQSRVGTAADVGGTRISTDTLDSTYKRVAATQGATTGVALQRQVLSSLVSYHQATAVADRLHVKPTQGLVDSDLAAVEAQVKASGQAAPEDLVKLFAQTQAVETALSDYYLAHGGAADSADVRGFQVKDAATGKLVVGKVAADGSNLAQLAATYGQGGLQPFAQVPYRSVKELAGLKKGQVTSATVNGQTGEATYVFVVDRQDDQTDVLKAISAVKVTVNPRFGAWTQDPTNGGFTIGPATTGVLSKADPSKVAETTAPVASAPPSAPSS